MGHLEIGRRRSLVGRELEPSRLCEVEGIVGIYDEVAMLEFLENRNAIQSWLDKRFGELGIDTDRHHSMEVSLNPYNRSLGLGIQSASLGIRRDGQPLRIPGAYKDSTIGVVTEGLLCEDEEDLIWDAVGFPVDKGSIERLHPLSRKLELGSRSGDRVKSGRVRVLRSVLDVVGPEFATTILQRKRTTEEMNKRGRKPTHGVYACDYLKAE